MIRPKYDLLQRVYFFYHGQLENLQITSILHSKYGVPPFTEKHGEVFYVSDFDRVVPEIYAFPTPAQAILAQIDNLKFMLKDHAGKNLEDDDP